MLDGLRILLAEDNPTNQMVAVQMLETLGADVTVATDGEEALEILGARDFDILLIDIEMPRKNGIEVVRALRAPGSRHAAVPMIALTAYVMREHREAIDAAGADGVIAKPIISIAEFGEQILALSARRLQRAPTAAAAAAARDPGATGRGAGQAAPVNGERCAPTGSRPAIDLEALAALGDAIGPAALAEILEKADADLRDAGAMLTRGLDASDEAAIRGALHILTGLAGSVGAGPLDNCARALQAAVHSGDSTQIQELGAAVPAAIEAALRGLASVRAG